MKMILVSSCKLSLERICAATNMELLQCCLKTFKESSSVFMDALPSPLVAGSVLEEALEDAFDSVDTNGDGELDVNEVMKACEGMEELKRPVQALKSYLKTRTAAPELDSEDEKMIEDWVTKELTTGDKTITDSST